MSHISLCVMQSCDVLCLLTRSEPAVPQHDHCGFYSDTQTKLVKSPVKSRQSRDQSERISLGLCLEDFTSHFNFSTQEKTGHLNSISFRRT